MLDDLSFGGVLSSTSCRTRQVRGVHKNASLMRKLQKRKEALLRKRLRDDKARRTAYEMDMT